MKIIFICGCLEPGKDGVGDYTRRLAGELIRQDISVGILSYNDTFVNEQVLEDQRSINTSIPCLRIPTSWSGAKRSNLAKKWVEQHNPEWLSLQFVPYSFNKKGLPFGLGQQLKHIGGDRLWHIMFHELWLGLRDNDSLKYLVIGYIQKFLINSLKKKINIKVVHTHTQLYLRELNRLDFKVKYLPIFSNIPFVKKIANDTFFKSKKVSFVIFGSIHPNAPVKQFSKELSSYFSLNTQSKCNLVLVGKSGNEQQKWVQEFELQNIEVINLGELSAQDISYVLQEVSYGITTNPAFVVEKSGTVAAMREHNLPILVVSENTKPKDSLDLNLPYGIWEYKAGNFSEFMNQKITAPNFLGITEITNNFAKTLFKELDF